MQKAKSIFKYKVEDYSKKVNVRVKGIIIKRLKNRWASMTKEGSLNINVNLLKAPEDIIDYIILHEICHLKIKEHSHHFWNLVYKFMPNYHEKVKWLKVNSASLLS